MSSLLYSDFIGKLSCFFFEFFAVLHYFSPFWFVYFYHTGSLNVCQLRFRYNTSMPCKYKKREVFHAAQEKMVVSYRNTAAVQTMIHRITDFDRLQTHISSPMLAVSAAVFG